MRKIMPRNKQNVKPSRETLLSGANAKPGRYAKPVKQWRVLDITKWMSMELTAEEFGFALAPEIRARLDEVQHDCN